MNRQAKSICVASASVIKASLQTNGGKHNPSIFSNMLYFGGVIYVALAGSADTVERFAELYQFHNDKARAIPKILANHPEYLEAVRQHVVRALTRTRKISELTEELAFLAAIDDEPELLHGMAAEWGVSLVSVGTLLAASTDLLESETTAPESVASIMTYVCRYVLTNTRPDEAWIYQYANEPPMLRLAGTISRALRSKEFEVAVKVMKQALVPARELLTPLQFYN